MSKIKIIDIHTHIYPDRLAPAATKALGEFYDFPIAGQGTYDDMRNSCLECDISGFLMLSVATNAHQLRRVNDTAAATAERGSAEGLEVWAFGGYHQDCEDPEKEIEHALEIGLRGFKIHPDIQRADIDDERFFPLYSMCEGRVPVYFHMGDCRPEYRFSEAAKLLKILEKFPSLSVCAAHLGGYTAWESSHLLADHPNIMFDTSSSLWALPEGRAEELIHMLGPERCMFGTDYPVMTAREELPRFLALKITEEERKMIAYDNAAKFLGINKI